MWCNRGGEEVRWGCPARGHGAVATQTRGCSQCLYQRLPKSYGNIRVNAPCRDDLSKTRIAIAEVLVLEKSGNYIGDPRRASYKSACTREKGGTGNDFGGRVPVGLSPRRSGVRSRT